MTRSTKTRTVPGSSDQVWAVLTDFGAISQWAPNVDHSCLLGEQSQGVGMLRRVQVGRMTLVEEVTEWEPGITLVYTLKGLPPVAEIQNEWHLSSVPEGTKVSLTTQIDPGPKPGHKLVAKLMGWKLASASKQMLAGMAEELS